MHERIIKKQKQKLEKLEVIKETEKRLKAVIWKEEEGGQGVARGENKKEKEEQ